MSWKAFIPPMQGKAITLDDTVGGLLTIGVAEKGRDVVLHVQDVYEEEDAYALLNPTEVRTLARYLNEMADRIEGRK